MWRVVALVYALLLAASYAVRAASPSGEEELPVGLHAVEVPEVRADGSTGERPIEIAYGDVGPRTGAPVIVAVHGSPSTGDELSGLAHELEDRFRVIWVHLPGFGDSTRDLPDYSFASHAVYVEELVDALGIERVHLVGYSMGGGVVLHLAERLGDRCESVTMLSAIGVQELEWLGDYTLNHGVHGLQLGALWLLHRAVPHFGALDGTMLSLEYARNFYDSDQRPLRGILEGLRVPVLVVHGRDDPLVPFAAAEEHHRIVPQSEASWYDGDHFTVFLHPELVAGPIGDFVARVERGEARTRSEAEPARVAAARLPFDPSGAPIVGFALFAICAMLAFATFVSEDLTCILAGALVAQGRLELLPATLACFVGIYVGDLLLFLAGRWLGTPALARAPLRWVVSKEREERAAEWLERRGLVVIFLSRFTPGMRLPTYFASGALGASAARFALFFAIAAGVWTPILVYLASILGGELMESLDAIQRNLPLGILVTLVVGYVVVKLVLPLFTWRGRRMLVGAFRRRVRWEFWPPWVFYPPIVVWICWLAIRHRSAAAWCAANPGIENGGVVGESKSAILAALASREPARSAVCRWCPLPASATFEERVAAFDAFREREGLGFPIVVKPDAGQRGSGVLVAKDEDAVRAYLREAEIDLVAQEFAPGPEFGVFWARRPSEPRGRVISITEKVLAEVVGDGERTLEELVLADPRAVCMADYYLHRNHERVNDVVPAGVRFVLGELGTHARGAIFLDGAELLTSELEDAIEGIAGCFDGFWFGRFDVRVPSRESLARGEGIRVVEVNGVTSESTHVYDPKHGVLTGWRTMAAQWSLCFEIGVENVRRGAAKPSLVGLLREWAAYRREQKAHQGG
ncbi:MAG: alpha/beta fold hydrolase [Planctomycetota bacterium]